MRNDTRQKAIVDAIKTIIRNKGIDVFDKPEVLYGMLCDYVADEKEWLTVFKQILDKKICAQLKSITATKDPKIAEEAIERLRESLKSYILPDDWIDSIINCFSEACSWPKVTKAEPVSAAQSTAQSTIRAQNAIPEPANSISGNKSDSISVSTNIDSIRRKNRNLNYFLVLVVIAACFAFFYSKVSKGTGISENAAISASSENQDSALSAELSETEIGLYTYTNLTVRYEGKKLSPSAKGISITPTDSIKVKDVAAGWKIQGWKPGKAAITVNYKNQQKTVELLINTVPPLLTVDKTVIHTGESASATISASTISVKTYAKGFSWEVSDSSILEVSEEGDYLKLTGRKPGEVKLTVNLYGEKASQIITINDVTGGKDHHYSFIKDDCSWTDAFNKAIDQGGYLVHIDSEEEYNYIIQQIKDRKMSNIQFRIGGRRDANSDKYYWVDQNNRTYGDMLNDASCWAYPYWFNGEPSFNDGNTLECYMDIIYVSAEKRFGFNDTANDIYALSPAYFKGKLGYIIEYDD